MKRRRLAVDAAAAEAAAATRALEEAAMAYAGARNAPHPSPVRVAVRSRDLVRAAKKCAEAHRRLDGVVKRIDRNADAALSRIAELMPSR